jgi:hypothetical protein
MSVYSTSADLPVQFVNRKANGARYCYEYCSPTVVELLNQARLTKKMTALCMFDFGNDGDEIFLQIRGATLVKSRGSHPMAKLDCMIPPEATVFLKHYQDAIVSAYAKSLEKTVDEFGADRVIGIESPTIDGCYRFDLKSKWFRGYVNGVELQSEEEMFTMYKNNKTVNLEIHFGKAKVYMAPGMEKKLVCVPFVRKIDIIEN